MKPVLPSVAAIGPMGRRRFVAAAPAVLVGASLLPACSRAPDPDSYVSVAERIRRTDSTVVVDGAALGQGLPRELVRELVRFATLAPSSHNTQCWKFALEGLGDHDPARPVAALPRSGPRRPPCLRDPGLRRRESGPRRAGPRAHCRGPLRRHAGDAVHVALAPTPAQASPLFHAIATRQCTRGDYDGKPLSSEDLTLLERAGTSNGVRMLLLTERPAMERVLELRDSRQYRPAGGPGVRQGAQVLDPLQRPRCGSHAGRPVQRVHGQPGIPAWLGDLAFGWFFTAKGENDKFARQVRNSAGIAVFVGRGRRQGPLGGGGPRLRALRAAGHGARHPQRLFEPTGGSGRSAPAVRRRLGARWPAPRPCRALRPRADPAIVAAPPGPGRAGLKARGTDTGNPNDLAALAWPDSERAGGRCRRPHAYGAHRWAVASLMFEISP